MGDKFDPMAGALEALDGVDVDAARLDFAHDLAADNLERAERAEARVAILEREYARLDEKLNAEKAANLALTVELHKARELFKQERHAHDLAASFARDLIAAGKELAERLEWAHFINRQMALEKRDIDLRLRGARELLEVALEARDRALERAKGLELACATTRRALRNAATDVCRWSGRNVAGRERLISTYIAMSAEEAS